MRRFALLFVLVAAVAVRAEEKKPESADGVWVVTSIEFAGTKISAEDLKKTPTTVTLKGDKWTVKMGDKVSSGTSKVDLTKKPAEIDTTETEGDNKGQSMKGIMEIKGDMMKVCFDGSGKARPKEFSTKDKPTYMLIEYKRMK